jgi:hypothetical protein
MLPEAPHSACLGWGCDVRPGGQCVEHHLKLCSRARLPPARSLPDWFLVRNTSIAAGIAIRPGRPLPGQDSHLLGQCTFARHTWSASPVVLLVSTRILLRRSLTSRRHVICSRLRDLARRPCRTADCQLKGEHDREAGGRACARLAGTSRSRSEPSAQVRDRTCVSQLG